MRRKLLGWSFQTILIAYRQKPIHFYWAEFGQNKQGGYIEHRQERFKINTVDEMQRTAPEARVPWRAA